MKLAIIGSRNAVVEDIGIYLPKGVTEIVSGGAQGIDRCAAKYAKENKILLTEFLPDYTRYGRGAPLVRNRQIVQYADEAIALWDGKSRGTAYTIRLFEKEGKKVTVIPIATGFLEK